MDLKQLLFQSAIAFTSGQVKSYELPPVPIKRIEIIHNSGSLSGGSSGSYIANTILEYLELRTNGLPLLQWKGDVDTDTIPNGMNALRKWNTAKSQFSPSNEYFVLDLPAPSSAKDFLLLSLKFNTIANINDGDRTGYTGTLDINIYVAGAGSSVKMGVSHHKIDFANGSGLFTNYLPPSYSGMKVKGIIMYLEDNGTASDSALSSLRLTDMSGRQYRDGKYATWREESDMNLGIDMGTGWVIFIFPEPIPIPANFFKFESRIDSAGTDVELHYWLIQHT